MFTFGNPTAPNSVRSTFSELIKKSLFPPLPSAPEVMLSTTPNQEVGLPAMNDTQDKIPNPCNDKKPTRLSYQCIGFYYAG